MNIPAGAEYFCRFTNGYYKGNWPDIETFDKETNKWIPSIGTHEKYLTPLVNKLSIEEHTIREDLFKLRAISGQLPGEALSLMLNNPQLYGLDSLSAEIHNQVSRLRLVQEKYLNSMEISFLETFHQYDY